MEHTITITDYGKDYGFGRYAVAFDGENLCFDDLPSVINKVSSVLRGYRNICLSCIHHRHDELCPARKEMGDTVGAQFESALACVYHAKKLQLVK